MALTTCLERCKMYHAVDGWVFGEDGVEGRLIGHVNLVKAGTLAAYELDAVDGDLGRIVEIVNNHHVVIVFEKCEGSKRANVAGATATHPGQL